jgi:RNA polymerase sigma-70 factor (ECF subfamily)
MNGEWEKLIVQRVLDGDHDAFAAIVETYGKPVYNLMYRMTGNRNDADDLAQETFLRAFENLGRFDARRRFFPWLYTVALNVARNHCKRSPLALWSNITVQACGNPESALQARCSRQQLQGCLNQLEPHEKEAVVLRYYQGLPFEEIAGILGISCSAVKMRVYRALKRIKGWMDGS